MIPRPDRVPKQILLVPEQGFAMAAAYGDVSGESGYPRAFLGHECLIAERGSRGGDRGGPTWSSRARSLPRGQGVTRPRRSPPFDLRGSWTLRVRKRLPGVFRGFSIKLIFLHKNETPG